MHQVVGDVDAVSNAAQRLGLEDIALVQLEASVRQRPGPLAVADQAADMPALVSERAGEPAADESGGPGDKGCSRSAQPAEEPLSASDSIFSRRV
jgi:hypothetical protein